MTLKTHNYVIQPEKKTIIKTKPPKEKREKKREL